MNINKSIEKELLFQNNIKDITSISLDNDYKIEENNVVGNFLINGEYKIHEVSINKEKFNFKIPFKHKIDEDIDLDSVKVEITNFTYDYKKDELIVNIEYSLLGDRKDIIEFDNKESLDEFLSNREVDIITDRIDEIKDVINNEENPVIEDTMVNKEENENIIEVNDEESDVDSCDNLEINETDRIESSTIMNNIKDTSDKFITYKVYKLNENETLESLVIKYHTSIDELKEYNDLTNLNIGDKIIIPKYE